MGTNGIFFPEVNFYEGGAFAKKSIVAEAGSSVSIGGSVSRDGSDIFAFPGFVDVHVHLRQPGFCYKETILSGSRAAAAGGYTAVCAMPNLDPVPDCMSSLRLQLEAIERDAAVRVLPYGSITRGEKGHELSDMEAMAPYVAGFSDDGKGVQSPRLMEQAMVMARDLGKLIVAHCEDESYPEDEREWRELERDLELAEKTGCGFHMCHMSSAKSLELMRRAKARGLNVTCETAPHYLLLDETMTRDSGDFKMNPPLALPEDREALLEGIQDGTIDMIATDHAPHSREEKSGGFKASLNGIVGLETAFPVLYTGLVEKGIITLPRLVELMSTAPAKRFGIDLTGDFNLFRLGTKTVIDPEGFASMGRATPFKGWEVNARCLATIHGGKVVYDGEGENHEARNV